MVDEIIEKIVLLIEPCLASQGFELVEVKVSCGRGSNFIEVLTDKPRGGITIYECAQLNKDIGVILEKENIFDGNYTLEVSSPGIDRPLVSVKDFLRVCGREITIYFKEPIHGAWECQGTVHRVENENIYIKNKQGEVVIPIQCINKAEQVI